MARGTWQYEALGSLVVKPYSSYTPKKFAEKIFPKSKHSFHLLAGYGSQCSKRKKKKGLSSQMSELSWFNLPTSYSKISQIATPLKSGSQIWSGLLLVKELTIHSFLALQISITILAQLLGTTNQHHNPCTASWHNNSALQSMHSFLLGTTNQQ